MSEPQPVWKFDTDAELAQAIATAGQVGVLIAEFYNTLVKNRVPQQVALSLTSAWMMATFGKKNA